MPQTLVVITCLCVVSAGDWPHWRGANRDDRSAEVSGWNGSEWAIGEPAWTARVGEGSTSPLVVKDRLYTGGWGANRDRIVCLDARTGTELWHQDYVASRYGRRAVGDQSLYAAFTASPEFDSQTGYLYTLGVDGALNCWDTNNKGRPVWNKNLYDAYQAPRRPEVAKRKRTRRDYGYTAAPLVHGDWLLVEVGSTKSGSIIAFDKKTGEQAWASESKDEAGHTGGLVPMMVEDIPCVVALTLRNLVVTRLDGENAGRTVGTYEWTTDYANNIATPAVHEDTVVVTSAYNHGAIAKLAVSMSGVRKVWEVRMASGVCTPVIHENRMYWAWHGVHCLDYSTGRKLWTGGKVGDAGSCILTSDDRLVIWSNRGDLSLVETAKRSASKYTELAMRKRIFRTDAWPHVVLSNGHLFCKDRAGNLQCYTIGK